MTRIHVSPFDWEGTGSTNVGARGLAVTNGIEIVGCASNMVTSVRVFNGLVQK